MNNVILAAFLGGWEILVILATLLLLLAFAGALAFLIVYLLRREKSKNPLPQLAPITEVILRRCPQCGKELKPDVPEGLCPACLLQRGLGTEGGAPPGSPPFVPPTIPDLAKLFPQLEMIELIGQGGMGAVYKARQPALDRFVALKILAPRSGGDQDFAERFTREARALAKLSHPNIVGVYDFGQVCRRRHEEADTTTTQSHPPPHVGAYMEGTLNYFIMEYVDGPNLRQIEQAGKLSPREALEIIPQICAALQFAHDEGIVHRDIKPENVLLDKKGRVKIADFGLAKILGQEPKDFRLTGARDVVGTPHYMAPEQVEKPQAVDHRADIYSLGVVFYEMLTGELPLGKFQPPSAKVQIDVRLDEVVLHALEKEPECRYQQASQVKTAVETIARTEKTEIRNPKSENERPVGKPAAPAYNPWEPVIIVAGISILSGILFAAPGLHPPFHASVIVICLIGLGICALRLAGLWPVSSPWFPQPNYSSRNLPQRRAVNQSSAGSPDKPADPLLAYVALYVPCLSGMLGIVTFFCWRWLPWPMWAWAILVPALLGIVLAIPVCRTRTGKKALVGGSLAALVWLVLYLVFAGMSHESAKSSAPPVPPVVIGTVPESGAAGVDPALTELQVTFSKPMQDDSWSWCRWADGNEENFPHITGSAHYLADGRTCMLPVKLEPGRTYALWLNRPDSARSFRGADGQPAVPYLLIFETRK
jgi:serine/threonine protein kinase